MSLRETTIPPSEFFLEDCDRSHTVLGEAQQQSVADADLVLIITGIPESRYCMMKMKEITGT